jgi:DNA-binding winged helix-turn-helix (wHTH) protein/Flp pilus assembly protein TadD
MSDTYRFGPFELDPRTAELRRNGEPVPLQLQPARILVLLVERAGALVTREEIRARVWPDRVVDYEQGLNYAIRQIRSALGDDAEAPAYVETLPRRGYRLAVTVERGPERTPVSARRQRILAFALAGLVLAAGGVAALSTVGREAQLPAVPHDPAARETYLVGSGLLASRDPTQLDKARQEFERVLQVEPDHAGALTGLGEALLRMGRGGEARRPLERAVRLAPEDPQAHHLLAQVLLFHGWEWDAAERHLARAMELRRDHAGTYQVRAYREVMTGRMDEALASIGTALRLDPLSSYVHADAGWIHYWAGRHEEAVARCRRTLELDAGSGSAKLCLLFARIAQADGAEALGAARALMIGHGAGPADLAALDGADPKAGLEAYWEWEARRLEALGERSAHDAFLLALACGRLGRRDEAFQELEAAYRGRTTWMLWLEVEPMLEPLRSDRRWQDLVRRMAYSAH